MVTCSAKSGLDDAIEQFFCRFDTLLDEDSEASLTWLDSASAEIRELDEWVMCRAEALCAARGVPAACAWLEQVIVECPGFADAHYRLAQLYELAGDCLRAIREHQATLQLDLEADGLVAELEEGLLQRIATEATNAIVSLPEAVLARLGHVPILLDSRPSEALVADGVDARSLGLFSGPDLCASESVVTQSLGPTEIRLFVHCLSDAFGLDEAELLEQVRVTVLHEIGHYLGLGEEELEARGLD